jgi:hypothetical protein
MLRLPTKLLAWFASSAVGDLVAQNLTRLHAPSVEILLHPSDMVISGRAAEASRARALIAEHLTFTRAYLTWSKEANEMEDTLRRIWHSVQGGAGIDALARLRALERRIERLSLPYEEWEVLFRQRLQVERAALRRVAGLSDEAATGTTMPPPDGALRHAMQAVAASLAELRRSWKTERTGRGLGLVPFLTAAATLATLLTSDRHPERARARTDLPPPDAHSEARLPRAA